MGALAAVAVCSCGIRAVPVPVLLHMQVSGAGACTIERTSVECGSAGAYIASLNAPSGCRILADVDARAPSAAVLQAIDSIQKSGFTGFEFVQKPARDGGT